MTVTIITRHELTQTDASDNETCYTTNKVPARDHTESLLRNLSTSSLKQSDETKNISEDEKNKEDEQVLRRLFSFDEAPHYLKHNSFIRSGYRGMLNTKLCFESIFWWTNETINIWSHIFGFLLFAGISYRSTTYAGIVAPWEDIALVSNVLVCFQVCMVLSSLYHTFSCRSEQDFNTFLMYDLFGIAISLLAIYTSGIYYAFWCDKKWRIFYISTVTIIFVGAMMLQLPKFKVPSHVKTGVFILWAAYGVIPTIHWTLRSGGLESQVVQLLLPRVIGMYLISGLAFLVYITKLPERLYAGKFDYLGHSHQWWHIIIVFALYFWHNSGIVYIKYRMNHACPSPSSYT